MVDYNLDKHKIIMYNIINTVKNLTIKYNFNYRFLIYRPFTIHKHHYFQITLFLIFETKIYLNLYNEIFSFVSFLLKHFNYQTYLG